MEPILSTTFIKDKLHISNKYFRNIIKLVGKQTNNIKLRAMCKYINRWIDFYNFFVKFGILVLINENIDTEEWNIKLTEIKIATCAFVPLLKYESQEHSNINSAINVYKKILYNHQKNNSGNVLQNAEPIELFFDKDMYYAFNLKKVSKEVFYQYTIFGNIIGTIVSNMTKIPDYEYRKKLYHIGYFVALFFVFQREYKAYKIKKESLIDKLEIDSFIKLELEIINKYIIKLSAIYPKNFNYFVQTTNKWREY